MIKLQRFRWLTETEWNSLDPNKKDKYTRYTILDDLTGLILYEVVNNEVIEKDVYTKEETIQKLIEQINIITYDKDEIRRRDSNILGQAMQYAEEIALGNIDIDLSDYYMKDAVNELLQKWNIDGGNFGSNYNKIKISRDIKSSILNKFSNGQIEDFEIFYSLDSKEIGITSGTGIEWFRQEPDLSDYAKKSWVSSEIDAKLTKAVRYKGSVDSYDDLMLVTGQVHGDFYNVIATGINYVWDADESLWDQVGGLTDLSEMASKEWVEDFIDSLDISTDAGSITIDNMFFPNTTVEDALNTIYLDVVKPYTYTFDSNGAIPIATVLTDIGLLKKSDMPGDPSKFGYDFEDWYDGATKVTYPYRSLNGFQVELKAIYNIWKYTVNFRLEDETIVDTFIVEYDQPLGEVLSVNGHMFSDIDVDGDYAPDDEGFIGWGVDEFTSFSQDKYNEGLTVDIYSTKIYHTYSFDSNGATPILTTVDEVEYLTAQDMPSDPSKYGYDFDAWYDNVTKVVLPYRSKSRIEEVELKAMYDIWKYTVNFRLEDETIVDTFIVEYDQPLGEVLSVNGHMFSDIDVDGDYAPDDEGFIGWGVDEFTTFSQDKNEEGLIVNIYPEAGSIVTTGFGRADTILTNDHTTTYTDVDGVRIWTSRLDKVYPFSELGSNTAPLVENGNTMLWLPEFYWTPKLDVNGYLREIEITEEAIDESSVLSRGRWVGKYMSVNVNSVAKSVSGQMSTGSISVNNSRTYSRANGAGYSMMNLHAWQSLMILMWVYFKTTNSDNYFQNINDTQYRNNGIMDGYKTAQNLTNGRNTFFGFENLLKEKFHCLDGVITNNRTLYVSDDYTKFNSTSVTNYTNIGSMPTTTNWIIEMGVTSGIIIPKLVSGTGSGSTYYSDTYSQSTSSNMALRKGSYYGMSLWHGPSYWHADYDFANTNASHASRLMKTS